MSAILAGELWATEGEWCVVVGPNDEPRSPNSFVMYRLHDGRTLYMHQCRRLDGDWKRCGLRAEETR